MDRLLTEAVLLHFTLLSLSLIRTGVVERNDGRIVRSTLERWEVWKMSTSCISSSDENLDLEGSTNIATRA